MNRFNSLALAFLVALTSASVPAMAADPIYVPFDEPGICGNDSVLNRITHRFRHQVRHVPHLPQVDIVHFDRVSERRFEPSVEDSPVERRYCHATVALSSGHSRDVWYLIERPMGFAGRGSNVEFCVSGFDRWYVYGGRCASLR